MANLRCSVYSEPALLETIWFKTNKQLQANTSSTLSWTKSALSVLEIAVMVLNRQQDFVLSDMVGQPEANFRCMARNQLGYSESCELSHLDRQTLLSK